MHASRFKFAACAALVLVTAACGNSKTIDRKLQIGGNPVLPDPQAYLLPPMKVPSAVGWKPGETTKVPAGLQVEALAIDLLHPRGLYVLPNGDVLIVQANGPGGSPTYRPKDLIAGRIKATGGTTGKGGNRITLVRYGADGKPTLRTEFLTNLHSPYGVALVGSDFYVANTDNIMKFPYQAGQTTITAAGVKLADLPGGPINHHWTKAMVASPDPDGSKLYIGVGSNSNIT